MEYAINFSVNMTLSCSADYAFLKTITEVCPGLRKLAFFPTNYNPVSEEQALISNALQTRPFYRRFPVFRDLCELETNMLAVRSEPFLTLGDLPRLKRLILHPVRLKF